MDRAVATTLLAADSRLLGLPISLSPVVMVPGAFRCRSAIPAKLSAVTSQVRTGTLSRFTGSRLAFARRFDSQNFRIIVIEQAVAATSAANQPSFEAGDRFDRT